MIVSPDADGNPTGPNFGAYFTEVDYARIPRWDFPSMTPAYVGDDSWGRAANPRHNNCCERPSPDDKVSLLLTPPAGQGQFLRYRYHNGQLAGAKNKKWEERRGRRLRNPRLASSRNSGSPTVAPENRVHVASIEVPGVLR